MALLTPQSVPLDGLAPTYTAASAGGDTVDPGRRAFLVVKNGDAASHTVTLATPGNLPTGDAYPDKTYTVPAGTELWIPLLDAYADPADGLAYITYDGVTSVTVAAILP